MENEIIEEQKRQLRRSPPSAIIKRMEILGIGIDLVEIERIERAITRYDDFVPRIFSPRERAKCEDCARPARRYAACFAAKEAVFKALSPGMKGFTWREVEMLEDENGRPFLALSGRMEEAACQRGVAEILISVSHSRDMAVVVVQAVGEGVQA